ncbi:regulatory protein RecX [Catenovulum maritimum]|uniref:Regulatory protein RecX n=1 Tax=Catenovulum maritimum TaxID=1513271 RepID=A0A0J8GQZ4_9ALTE|nr:regulatory protein RecX [Catenovulum maritimum]KMT65250.1 hypothetical protein XM47_09415 [Catenovulum maritimum]
MKKPNLDFSNLTEAEIKQKAINYLTWLLARRDYSQFDLKQKLQQKQYPSQIIEAVLLLIEENGWQSDLRYARLLMRTKAQSGYGPNKIKQIFQQHQIKVDFYALELELEICWLSALIDLNERKYRTPVTDFKEKQKRFRFFYQRGYTSEQIQDFWQQQSEQN